MLDKADPYRATLQMCEEDMFLVHMEMTHITEVLLPWISIDRDTSHPPHPKFIYYFNVHRQKNGVVMVSSRCMSNANPLYGALSPPHPLKRGKSHCPVDTFGLS